MYQCLYKSESSCSYKLTFWTETQGNNAGNFGEYLKFGRSNINLPNVKNSVSSKYKSRL